jgi:hypothetical protein
MSKALLMSILVATIALPANLAKDPNPLRALKRTFFWMAAFEVFYVAGLVFLYPKLMM